MTKPLTYTDYLQNIFIGDFNDKASAEAYLAEQSEGVTGYIIEQPADVKQMTVKVQVDLFNALREDGQAEVKLQHFHNADDRVGKLFARIEGTRVGMTVDRQPKVAPEDQCEKEVKAKEERAPRGETASKSFAGKPVREGSSLAAILASLQAGPKTAEEVAKEVGGDIRPDQVAHRIRHVLHVNHGVSYAKDAEGRFSITGYAEGFTAENMITKKGVPAAAGESAQQAA